MEPMPLTPFERYMVFDDRPGAPMTFVARMRLRGTLQPQPFAAAAAEALQRHPLLRARLQSRFGRMWWEFPPCGEASVERLDEEGAVAARKTLALDPRREDGVRLLVRTCGAGTEILGLFHHGCTDGVGAYRFLGEVLALYGRRVGGPRLPTLAPLDPRLLRRRYPFRVETPEPPPPWEAMKFFVKEGWELFSRAAETISWGPPPGTVDAAWLPAQASAPLSPSEGRGLRIAAQKRHATVNDLLLRDLYLTLGDWNRERGRDPDGRWLRITMPTNMRLRDDDAMPAANVIGYAFLTVPGGACSDPAALLQRVGAATAAVRKWGLGAMFVEGVRLADLLPGALPFALGRIERMSTAILSNLGDVVRRFTAKFPLDAGGEPIAGDVVLEELSGAPPVRPGTTAAFFVSSLAGRTTLSLQVDPQRASKAQAAALLERWRLRLVDSAAGRG